MRHFIDRAAKRKQVQGGGGGLTSKGVTSIVMCPPWPPQSETLGVGLVQTNFSAQLRLKLNKMPVYAHISSELPGKYSSQPVSHHPLVAALISIEIECKLYCCVRSG